MSLEERSFMNMLNFHRDQLLSIEETPLGKIFSRYERRRLTQYGILARSKYETGRPLVLTPEALDELKRSSLNTQGEK